MELSFIRDLYDADGPCASVYLDATHDSEPARNALKIRWKNLRAALSEQHLDEPTLRSLDAEVVDDRTMRALDSASFERGAHPGRHGLALFGGGGEVRYAEVLSEPPDSDHAEVSALPHLAPLMSLRGERVSWLRVVVNRVGADISDRGGSPIQVDGTHLSPIRKSHGGGWSQEHLHRKAEMRWQANAIQAAEQVVRLAESIGAELVVVAGEVRGRGLLIEALPERWADRVVEVEAGSRAPGADPAAVEEATRVAVADAVRRRQAAAIDRFTVRGGEYAAIGAPAVVAAFERGQVDTLLLDPQAIAGRELWVGLDVAGVSENPDELRRRGARRVERVPAGDALIRSAAATDAGLITIPRGAASLDEGIGAILRYADAATPHR